MIISVCIWMFIGWRLVFKINKPVWVIAQLIAVILFLVYLF